MTPQRVTPRSVRSRLLRSVAVVLIASAAVTACSSSSSKSSTSTTASKSTTTIGVDPSATATTTTLEPEAGVGRISYVYGPEVGDCIDLRSVAAGRAVTTRAIPTADATLKSDKDVMLRLNCDLPHQYEVIAVPASGLGAAPTTEQLIVAAKRLCPAAFTSYIGIAYSGSSLEAGWVLPNDEQRNRSVQTIGCTAFDPKGKLVGSVRDSRR